MGKMPVPPCPLLFAFIRVHSRFKSSRHPTAPRTSRTSSRSLCSLRSLRLSIPQTQDPRPKTPDARPALQNPEPPTLNPSQVYAPFYLAPANWHQPFPPKKTFAPAQPAVPQRLITPAPKPRLPEPTLCTPNPRTFPCRVYGEPHTMKRHPAPHPSHPSHAVPSFQTPHRTPQSPPALRSPRRRRVHLVNSKLPPTRGISPDFAPDISSTYLFPATYEKTPPKQTVKTGPQKVKAPPEKVNKVGRNGQNTPDLVTNLHPEPGTLFNSRMAPAR
jgi:hypothetical protein